MIGEITAYFTDAVLRAPTIGSMLMCFAASQVGVIAFLRKQSLLGEALSHSAYPGVIFGIVFSALLSVDLHYEFTVPLLIMSGAFLTALGGLFAIRFLERRFKIRSDSALCFVLSAFFGIGMTWASQVQFTHTVLYKQSFSYIYGQAATMTDIHIFIYGALSLLILAVIILFYKELQTITFDVEYAKSIGINIKLVEGIIFVLIALAVVIGMRSVGVVLMSAMLIAPAACARQFTNRLSSMLWIAGLIGLFSGFWGNVLSTEATEMLATRYPGDRLVIPTGPAIVLVAALFTVAALMCAPERGLLLRFLRIGLFQFKCGTENVLKAVWREDPKKAHTIKEIQRQYGGTAFSVYSLLLSLRRAGWIKKVKRGEYRLTQEGVKRAEHIVRLHRLWEVYLVEYLDVGAERVHHNAEQMEHIITPELEKELTELLKDPKQDPHHQPIPPPTRGKYE